MKIICSKELLCENIAIASRAVTTKSSLEILSCILLVADSKGFRMIGNNLQLGIETADIPAEIAETGTVAAEARLLNDIVRRLPHDSVTIVTDERNVIRIISGHAEFSIVGMSGDEFPYLTEVEKTNRLTMKSEDLREMVKSTIFAVSLNEAKPVMTGELLIADDDKLVMVAVDGFRIAEKSLPRSDSAENSFAGQMIIPSTSLSEIVKIIGQTSDEEVEAYVIRGCCMFETPSCRIVTRLIEGEFIKFESLFSTEFTTVVTVDRALLTEALERASLITSKDLKKSPVKISIEGEQMTISSISDMGSTTECLSINTEGKDLIIAFNPRYLLEALRAIGNEKITIQLLSPLSPCVITPADDDSYRYLVLPLRLKE